MKANVAAFFDKTTCTVTYVVADPASAACAVIDPVLDYDAKSGRTTTASANEVLAFIGDKGLKPEWILETHVHADHLSAAQYLRAELGVGTKVGIGSAIPTVQKTFAKIFNIGSEFATDGSQWDHLFEDNGAAPLGELTIEAMHTPGHTPACTCYSIGDAVFTGDAIFMPDMGTGRCDFPGGSAAALYASVQRILALAPETRIFVGHDYGAGGRAFAWESTVAQQRAENIHLRNGTDEQTFVAMREARDGELDLPNLILPSVQVNIRGGAFPPPEENGLSYLKIPLNAL
jgi:glyoxylase-like metal-dependent hydrolase (beta-lactamase superfamily II)